MTTQKTNTKRFNGDRYNEAVTKIENEIKNQPTNPIEKDASYIELVSQQPENSKTKFHRVYINRDQIIFESAKNPAIPLVFVCINRPDISPVQGFWIEKKWIQGFDRFTRDVLLACTVDGYKRLVYELVLQNDQRYWRVVADVPASEILKAMVYRGVATDALAQRDKWETFTEFKARTEK